MKNIGKFIEIVEHSTDNLSGLLLPHIFGASKYISEQNFNEIVDNYSSIARELSSLEELHFYDYCDLEQFLKRIAYIFQESLSPMFEAIEYIKNLQLELFELEFAIGNINLY